MSPTVHLAIHALILYAEFIFFGFTLVLALCDASDVKTLKAQKVILEIDKLNLTWFNERAIKDIRMTQFIAKAWSIPILVCLILGMWYGLAGASLVMFALYAKQALSQRIRTHCHASLNTTYSRLS